MDAMKNICVLLIIIIGLQSCGLGTQENQNKEIPNKTATSDSTYFTLVDTLVKNLKVRVIISEEGLVAHLNEQKKNLPWGVKRGLPKQILTGLFFIDDKKITNKEVWFKDNLLLFTIFDELYRGELFILNLDTGLFIKQKSSKNPFLNSDVGPFIIDKKTNRIITTSNTLINTNPDIQNRSVGIYSFSDKEIKYERNFEYSQINQLTDEDYLSIFDNYRRGLGF